MTAGTLGSRRIGDAFTAARAEQRIAFVPYVVAGYPDFERAERLALSALDAGADLLEIGLPYSDPLADGVTLQRAGASALEHGADLDSSFDLVERVCRARPHKPVLVMGYANQFLGPRGAEATAARLARAGAAGAIVADLPPDEGEPLEAAFAAHDLALVYLVAPTSSAERISMIGERAGGFVYCVSLTGVTGARSSGPAGNIAALLNRVKASTPLPVAVGFGVSKAEHVRAVARAGADGVIVGSALVDVLGPDGRDEEAFAALCAAVRAATHLTPAPASR